MLAMGGTPNIPSPGAVPGTPMPQIDLDLGGALATAKQAATMKPEIERTKSEAEGAFHNAFTAGIKSDQAHSEALIAREGISTAKSVREQEALKLNEMRATSKTFEGKPGRIIKGVEKAVKAISPLK